MKKIKTTQKYHNKNSKACLLYLKNTNRFKTIKQHKKKHTKTQKYHDKTSKYAYMYI